jgi:hypothetical protein
MAWQSGSGRWHRTLFRRHHRSPARPRLHRATVITWPGSGPENALTTGSGNPCKRVRQPADASPKDNSLFAAFSSEKEESAF